jgi:hypothetical protein
MLIRIPNEELRIVIIFAAICSILGNLMGIIDLLRRPTE